MRVKSRARAWDVVVCPRDMVHLIACVVLAKIARFFDSKTVDCLYCGEGYVVGQDSVRETLASRLSALRASGMLRPGVVARELALALRDDDRNTVKSLYLFGTPTNGSWLARQPSTGSSASPACSRSTTRAISSKSPSLAVRAGSRKTATRACSPSRAR